MIPKKYTGKMLAGRKARVLQEACNGAGQGLTAGAVVTIVRAVPGQGLTIKTETCPHCGQFTRMTGLRREELELIPEPEKE